MIWACNAPVAHAPFRDAVVQHVGLDVPCHFLACHLDVELDESLQRLHIIRVEGADTSGLSPKVFGIPHCFRRVLGGEGAQKEIQSTNVDGVQDQNHALGDGLLLLGAALGYGHATFIGGHI